LAITIVSDAWLDPLGASSRHSIPTGTQNRSNELLRSAWKIETKEQIVIEKASKERESESLRSFFFPSSFSFSVFFVFFALEPLDFF